MALLVIFVAPMRGDAPAAAPAQIPDANAVIQYLNQSIDWHRHLANEEALANDAADILFLNDAKQIANQALQLSFDFAKADATLLGQPGAAASAIPSNAASTGYGTLAKRAQEADAEVKERQAELQDAERELETASARKRRALEEKVGALQAEVELEQTRSQTLHSILQYVGGAGAVAAGGNLEAQIDELQHSVPELESAKSANGQPAAAPATPARRAQPNGIVELISDLIALNRKSSALRQASDATDALSQTARGLRSPLVSKLDDLAKQGDQLVEQNAGATPEDEKKELGAVTAQFKQVSAALVPLGRQGILLRSYKANLLRWRAEISNDYTADLRNLFFRLALLGMILAVVVALSEIWRRAVFRYVHDIRRRYQFLLLRRIILWCTIALVVAFALASEIGSLATFVGLITAGIAVALQNVILSVAGYFFLIGKYGVRVGDRVQIGNVVGDVLDIGLVRLHLIEFAESGGTARQPTGRVVVFSNSIVFQPGASFYKQIPGTHFNWREVKLTLAPEGDYRQAEKRLLGAVQKVYAEYREEMETQHRAMERELTVPIATPQPHSRLTLTQNGLEVVIRYPVVLENAAEIDDRVTRELLLAIEKSPRLKLVGSGTPNIQAVAEPSEPTAKAS